MLSNCCSTGSSGQSSRYTPINRLMMSWSRSRSLRTVPSSSLIRRFWTCMVSLIQLDGGLSLWTCHHNRHSDLVWFRMPVSCSRLKFAALMMAG